MGLTAIGLLISFFIYWLWWRGQEKKGKEIKWYYYLLMPHEVLFFKWFVVLGIIAALVFLFQMFPLKLRKTERLMRSIEVAAIEYWDDQGELPVSIDDLIRNNPNRKSWRHDHWGTEIKLENSGTELRIISAASDKTFNTSDDIIRVINK